MGLQCDFMARQDNMSSVAGRGYQWQTDWALCLSGSCAERSLSGKNLSDSQLTWPQSPQLSHSRRPALWLLEAFRGLVNEASKRRKTPLLSHSRLPTLQLCGVLLKRHYSISFILGMSESGATKTVYRTQCNQTWTKPAKPLTEMIHINDCEQKCETFLLHHEEKVWLN